MSSAGPERERTAADATHCDKRYSERENGMSRAPIVLAAALVLAFALACGSADDESAGAVGGTMADLSQFPTPSRSQATPRLEPQASQDEAESGTTQVAPMTQEELQQLRARLRSGDLSAEERQELIQQLQAQFGAGPGGGRLGGGGGSQAVGSIESVSGNTITIATEIASISAVVGEATNIRITSVLDPEALTEGVPVRVVSERVGGSTLARVITVLADDQGQFGGGRGGQGGQGGGPGAPALSGTIDSIRDDQLTLDTQQGPLPIAINEETVIVQTGAGTFADLAIGMRVTVVGLADESGRIDARAVFVIPEGMENVPGFGGGGRQGRGGGAGGGP